MSEERTGNAYIDESINVVNKWKSKRGSLIMALHELFIIFSSLRPQVR